LRRFAPPGKHLVSLPIGATHGGTNPDDAPARALLSADMRHSIATHAVRVVALAAVATAALAAEPAASPERAAYLRYCGACHGSQGQGDGVAGSFMRPKPKDLTQIAKENGGTFPFTKTMAAIDGTKEVRAHGDPDMPVWGEIFRQGAAEPTRNVEVKGNLMLITQYLQSIQAK
jgi:mono/diheme cytochrome c family protein